MRCLSSDKVVAAGGGAAAGPGASTMGGHEPRRQAQAWSIQGPDPAAAQQRSFATALDARVLQCVQLYLLHQHYLLSGWCKQCSHELREHGQGGPAPLGNPHSTRYRRHHPDNERKSLELLLDIDNLCSRANVSLKLLHCHGCASRVSVSHRLKTA
jgi:hypothetical protein